MSHSVKCLVEAVYLPFLIGAGLYLGINVAALKKDPIFLHVLSVILLLLSWRILLADKVNSTRYYFIFCYAGIMLSCEVIEWIRKANIGGQPNRKTVLKSILVCAAFFSLLFFCIKKNLKPRKYNQSIKHLCETTIGITQSDKSKIIIEKDAKECNRCKYYLGEDESRFLELDSGVSFEDKLDTLFNNKGDLFFCITDCVSGDKKIKTKENQYRSREVASFLTKKKGKNRLVLYRIEPECPNILSQEEFDHEVSGKVNLCKNGDFRDIETNASRIEHYREIMTDKNKEKPVIPKDWNIYDNRGIQWCQLIRESDTKNALLIHSVWGQESVVMSSLIRAETDNTLYIEVRNNNIVHSDLKVRISHYDSINKRTGFVYNTLSFSLKRGKRYYIKEDILLKSFPEGISDYHITFCVNGMIMLENVYIVNK